MRTILLTERVRSEVRLTPADAAFLAERHPHLLLTPTAGRRRWLLTPGRLVGVVTAPTCRLLIRPKLPLRTLFFLLDPDRPPPTAETGRSDRHWMLDPLALRLAALMAERSAAGLGRGYAERSGHGAVLEGRPDVAAQVRDNPARKDRLHWQGDDWSADVPPNQAARAAAEGLLATGLVGEAARSALRSALGGFEGVRPLVPPSGWFVRREAESDRDGYGPLLAVCRLVLEGMAQDGGGAAPTFLLDLERLWERYVTRGLAAAFAGVPDVRVAVQVERTVTETDPGRPGLTMRPDVTVERSGRTPLAADAKWKRAEVTGPATDDLYQALAYATALGASRTLLIYPGRKDGVRRHFLPQASVTLEVRTLRVTGEPAECLRSLGRLGRRLRRLCGL
jgi:5-methylcytosine-specific restriction enzyme subunit McrC